MTWQKMKTKLWVRGACLNLMNENVQNNLYSGDLKSWLVWILNGRKEVGLQMVQISNLIWNSKAQPFEIRTNGCHFIKNHLKSRQKHIDFEWSSFWMVGTIAIAIAKAQPFENWTTWHPTFKKSRFQMFQDAEWPISIVRDLKLDKDLNSKSKSWLLNVQFSNDYLKAGQKNKIVSQTYKNQSALCPLFNWSD